MNEEYHWPLSSLSSCVPPVETLKMVIFGIRSPQQFTSPIPSSSFCRFDWPNPLELSHKSNYMYVGESSLESVLYKRHSSLNVRSNQYGHP